MPRLSDCWTTGEVSRAVELYRSGHSSTEIALRLGRASSGVCRHLRRAGVMVSQPEHLPTVRANLSWVEAWRGEGLTLQECANRLRMPLACLYRHLVALDRRDLARGPGKGQVWTGKPRLKADRESIAMGQRNCYRDRAAALGWPEADTPTEARLMALLATEPLTAREICARMGWQAPGQPARRQSPTLQSYLARLRKKGYLERTPARPARYRLVAWLRARKEDEREPA